MSMSENLTVFSFSLSLVKCIIIINTSKQVLHIELNHIFKILTGLSPDGVLVPFHCHHWLA